APALCWCWAFALAVGVLGALSYDIAHWFGTWCPARACVLRVEIFSSRLVPARISRKSPILRRERRVLIEPAQDLVAAQVGHLEQHARDFCLAIGRERRPIGRRVENRDRERRGIASGRDGGL